VRCELEAFAQDVEGGAAYPIAEADMLATLAAFEATLASLRTGSPAAPAS
jgi:predicted dehydrogenase